MNWSVENILLLLLINSICPVFSNELGSTCDEDRDCNVAQSACISGICACNHFYAQYNATTCLQSILYSVWTLSSWLRYSGVSVETENCRAKLLDDKCLVNEQCSLRVANSVCRDEICQCSKEFIPFRKHTCLSPAKPGDVCYSEEHCQMYSRTSHCEFIISNLFGKCKCEKGGTCGLETPATPDQEKNDTNMPQNPEPAAVAVHNNQNAQSTQQKLHGQNPWADQTASSSSSDPLFDQKHHSQKFSHQNLTDSTTDESTTERFQHFMSTDESKYRIEPSSNETHDDIWETRGVSLGFPCQEDLECQMEDSESRCIKGICDCAVKHNSTKSCGSQNTGCAPETFQCRRSGVCISWFFVCDGRKDCPDGSDEDCQGPMCPAPSFQCGRNGYCVSLAVVCDGIKNCPHGEDENFCMPQHREKNTDCPEETFQCGNGRCLPKFEFCNAIPKCGDGSDESLDSCRFHYHNMEANAKVARRGEHYCPFECGNGQCRSTAILCTGRDGCGDNSDEANCSVCRCPKIA